MNMKKMKSVMTTMTMNEYQTELYQNLMSLTQANEAFYFSDQVLDNSVYRIFNYRLASYSNFLLPGALECRGIMFEIDDKGGAIRLASFPMHKFFNLYENPFTTYVNLTSVKEISVKSDGSLISTYIHDLGDGYEMRLKSKGSVSSDQVISAYRWLQEPAQRDLWMYLDAMTFFDCTVNMEWVSPKNRIVLGYLVPKLIILNVRSNRTGLYIQTPTTGPGLLYREPLVDTGTLSIPEFINQVPDMLDDIEGFVCKTDDIWFKLKTKKYLALHHCKDSVNNPRRLFEVILNEGIDDVKSMFHEDELLMKQINDMEQKVETLYNHMVNEVETFYRDNKFLDRKDYAIKAQSEVTKLYFGLVMNKYVQRPDHYKEFLISKWKDLGVKDETSNYE